MALCTDMLHTGSRRDVSPCVWPGMVQPELQAKDAELAALRARLGRVEGLQAAEDQLAGMAGKAAELKVGKPALLLLDNNAECAKPAGLCGWQGCRAQGRVQCLDVLRLAGVWLKLWRAQHLQGLLAAHLLLHVVGRATAEVSAKMLGSRWGSSFRVAAKHVTAVRAPASGPSWYACNISVPGRPARSVCKAAC